MIEIRPAGAADAEVVADLAGRLAQSFPLSRESFDLTYPTVLASDDACLMLAVDGDECIGYVFGSHHLTFYANGPVASVAEIFVRDDFRGRGIGRDLMVAFESWALDQGCVLVALATRRAAPFYTAIGYDESATYFAKAVGGG